MTEYDERIPAPIFRFVEYKLYHYRENKATINALRDMKEDIIQKGRQWINEPITTSGKSNMVENIAVKLLLLEEKAEREKFWIDAIEDVLSILSDQDKRLIELKYFDAYLTNAGVARELNISERTFYERREEIIRRFAIRFGLL